MEVAAGIPAHGLDLHTPSQLPVLLTASQSTKFHRTQRTVPLPGIPWPLSGASLMTASVMPPGIMLSPEPLEPPY